MNEPLLDIRGLTVRATTPQGEQVTIVDRVDLEVAPHEVLCIVGESGSGKSVTMLAAMGLLAPGLDVTTGQVMLGDEDLLTLPEPAMRAHRGQDLGMVFQDPMTALNPVKRVGQQIARAVQLHQGLRRRAAFDRAVELLETVGVPDAHARAKDYPHQWSGGMRQRAVIAMAMANSPQVLVADEPTTALDVTVQKQVMDVLATARRATGAAMVMITHDLGLVAQVADRVAIMYSGRIVEQGGVHEIFEHPTHPYTQGLLASLLTGDLTSGRAVAIEGAPPTPANRPAGCAFAPRCTSPARSELCGTAVPILAPADGPHRAACHHAHVARPTLEATS